MHSCITSVNCKFRNWPENVVPTEVRRVLGVPLGDLTTVSAEKFAATNADYSRFGKLP